MCQSAIWKNELAFIETFHVTEDEKDAAKARHVNVIFSATTANAKELVCLKICFKFIHSID